MIGENIISQVKKIIKPCGKKLGNASTPESKQSWDFGVELMDNNLFIKKYHRPEYPQAFVWSKKSFT